MEARMLERQSSGLGQRVQQIERGVALPLLVVPGDGERRRLLPMTETPEGPFQEEMACKIPSDTAWSMRENFVKMMNAQGKDVLDEVEITADLVLDSCYQLAKEGVKNLGKMIENDHSLLDKLNREALTLDERQSELAYNLKQVLDAKQCLGYIEAAKSKDGALAEMITAWVMASGPPRQKDAGCGLVVNKVNAQMRNGKLDVAEIVPENTGVFAVKKSKYARRLAKLEKRSGIRDALLRILGTSTTALAMGTSVLFANICTLWEADGLTWD